MEMCLVALLRSFFGQNTVKDSLQSKPIKERDSDIRRWLSKKMEISFMIIDEKMFYPEIEF